MQTCYKCQTQSPDTAYQCEQCGADLKESSLTAVALKSYQQNPRVKYIRIMITGDCCPACSEAGGAFPKDAVPHLPVEGCSHPLGCRCFYQPFLTELFP